MPTATRETHSARHTGLATCCPLLARSPSAFQVWNMWLLVSQTRRRAGEGCPRPAGRWALRSAGSSLTVGLGSLLHFSTDPGGGTLIILKRLLKFRDGRLWKHLPNSSVVPGGEDPQGEWEELAGRRLRVGKWGPHESVEGECSRRGSPAVSSCHYPKPLKIRRALLALPQPQHLLGWTALTIMDTNPSPPQTHAILGAQLCGCWGLGVAGGCQGHLGGCDMTSSDHSPRRKGCQTGHTTQHKTGDCHGHWGEL